MQKPNEYQLAIEAIRESSKLHKVRYQIAFFGPIKTVGKNSDKWRVSVMGKHFIKKEFTVAVREAILMVLSAHTANKHQ